MDWHRGSYIGVLLDYSLKLFKSLINLLALPHHPRVSQGIYQMDPHRGHARYSKAEKFETLRVVDLPT
jgi:hypothetical protein